MILLTLLSAILYQFYYVYLNCCYFNCYHTACYPSSFSFWEHTGHVEFSTMESSAAVHSGLLQPLSLSLSYRLSLIITPSHLLSIFIHFSSSLHLRALPHSSRRCSEQRGVYTEAASAAPVLNAHTSSSLGYVAAVNIAVWHSGGRCGVSPGNMLCSGMRKTAGVI